MKMEVKKEAPAFILRGSSYNGCGEYVEVSYTDLRAANIGDAWEGYDNHNCGRALNEESAEVVYKTDNGVAVLRRRWGTTDSPDPENWEDAPELIWYEFA
ncbi:hypothetical protein [uncultured Mitsuokella sp.]|uniref:hypothetical protein n=1 Tax=uncultured Mitsuokella sp. TaxID=453120 RepID=UPI00260FA6CC|nr:hypothetical protein [uncultured Mitsuokella sp.]